MRQLIAGIGLILLSAATYAQMSLSGVQTRPTKEVEAQLPNVHPSLYYAYAMRLFEQDRKDDAVFWFYAGQLRYRFYLLAKPQPPDQDPAIFASLNSNIGQTINEYAAGDPKMLAAQIERVLKWDAATKNGFTSKEQFKPQWQETRSGLAELEQEVKNNADEIHRQREASGLSNR